MYHALLEQAGYSDDDILAVYSYGSRVYGTASKTSDYDYNVVVKELKSEAEQLFVEDHSVTINVYSEPVFIERIAKHRISALECIFLPPDKIIKETTKYAFVLDRGQLRESVSEKASKAFNQCRKRLMDDQGINPATGQVYDRRIYEAKKALFHCFRIIDFGMQIAKDGKIYDYGRSNQLWKEIMDNPSEDWEVYRAKYKETYNAKMTEFRKLAPKEIKDDFR
jgi:predicted nucleotidyltransferase